MGARGPQPKPTGLKLVQGTYRKDRAPKREPKPVGDVGAPPRYLDAEAKRIWRREAKAAGKWIKASDRGTFAVYCQTESDLIRWERKFRGQSRIQVSEKSGLSSVTGEWTLLRALRTDLVRFAALLGLNPSARTRIEMPEPEVPENPWEKFGTT